MKSKSLLIVLFLFSVSLFAQEDPKETEKEVEKTEGLVIQKIVKKNDSIDALAPSRAAFYSAILPGLGQAYNKKYWKIPIVYAAIGTGIYFYIDNTQEYNRYRDAYKSRLAGKTDDEFPGISDDGLINAQKTLRTNRELSLLVTVGLYALNIIDANVDAHLLQYNVDENLAVKPHYKINEFDNTGSVGFTLNFKID